MSDDHLPAVDTDEVSTWAGVAEWLARDEPAVLVTVVDHEGSVPGVTGTRMAVGRDRALGTVGGGVAEAAMLEAARTMDGRSALRRFDHHGPDAPSICSGTQRFALLALRPDDLPTVEDVVATLREARVGTVVLGPDGLRFDRDERRPPRFLETPDGWMAEHTVGRQDSLYIIGGGHVALALSRVMATLPFRIVVLDDRRDLETMRLNHFAHEKRVVDYRHVADHVPEGPSVYAVVMTHGHGWDAEVLRRLAGRRVRYLGLLGSTTKVRKTFATLRAEGVEGRWLDALRAPVGLPIGSHTPEEIAVSIAAEILQVRSSSPETLP